MALGILWSRASTMDGLAREVFRQVGELPIERFVQITHAQGVNPQTGHFEYTALIITNTIAAHTDVMTAASVVSASSNSLRRRNGSIHLKVCRRAPPRILRR